jgi:hypothetical protein
MRVSNDLIVAATVTSKRYKGLASISGPSTERSQPKIDADGLLGVQKAICDSDINSIMSTLVENLSRGL